MQEYVALIHSLLAADIPFTLFPASPTPYELRHLVKVSKIKKIFASPRNFESARNSAKEVGSSESDGVFTLGRMWRGIGRSMASFVPLRNPRRRILWHVSSFPVGRPAHLPCHRARAHCVELLGVMNHTTISCPQRCRGSSRGN
jgi:hypothetical protein